MKVVGGRAFPVETPPPHRGGRNWLFVRLDTDSGISGYGEVLMTQSAFRLGVQARLLTDLVDQYVVGFDPYDIEAMFNRIYALAGYSRYPDHTKLGLLSAIEMACWDIVGKDTRQPVHRLLGGKVRDRLRSYTYISSDDTSTGGVQSNHDLWHSPEEVAARARHYRDLGFSALKLDPFITRLLGDHTQGQIEPVQYSLRAMENAEATIGAIRDAVGSDCDILIGTHGQMTAAGAIRVAKRLEQFDPLWFEEPVPPENVAEMAKVARATSIPITTGERLTTKYEFARVVAHEAAAIFNLDVGLVGGILEAKKIAAIAEAAYLQISPHVYSGPLIAAASIQLGLCCPNFLIMESIERFDGFSAEIVDPPIEWREGFIVPSDRPGLGHDLREDVAEEYAPQEKDREPVPRLAVAFHGGGCWRFLAPAQAACSAVPAFIGSVNDNAGPKARRHRSAVLTDSLIGVATPERQLIRRRGAIGLRTQDRRRRV